MKRNFIHFLCFRKCHLREVWIWENVPWDDQSPSVQRLSLKAPKLERFTEVVPLPLKFLSWFLKKKKKNIKIKTPPKCGLHLQELHALSLPFAPCISAPSRVQGQPDKGGRKWERQGAETKHCVRCCLPQKRQSGTWGQTLTSRSTVFCGANGTPAHPSP